ncbi:MAG TPA: DMT family transporter [Deinococcales bacterium]|nr:DMT family transporter [Deinococcales bacterium]
MPPVPEARPSTARLVLALAVGVLAVSFAAIFIRYARLASGSEQAAFSLLIAAGRMLVAAAILTPVGLVQLRRERPPFQAVLLGVLAGAALAAHFATWISSLAFTSVAASTAIVTTNPVWVSLAAWLFLRERPRPQVLLGAGVALAGGLLIALSDSSGGGSGSAPLLGDLLALLGAFGASAYFLLGRSAQRAGLSLPAYSGLAYGVAAVLLLPAPLMAGVPYGPYPFAAYLWIALLGIVPQVVGHTTFNWSVRYLDPAVVTMVILLEPVGSAAAALLLFREFPGPLTLVGAAVILLGVLLAVRPQRVRPA